MNTLSDIIARFGERGKNICNLYTAGYFDSQIKPLYEEVGTSDLLQFNQIYEQIVTESPYAVFIHAEMSVKNVGETVKQKMEISKKYGIKYLNIHGIGKDNVDKITILIKEFMILISFVFSNLSFLKTYKIDPPVTIIGSKINTI